MYLIRQAAGDISGENFNLLSSFFRCHFQIELSKIYHCNFDQVAGVLRLKQKLELSHLLVIIELQELSWANYR